MDKEQRNTRHQVMGIVLMVYDLCEKYGVTVHPKYFGICIEKWIEEGITPSSLPAIPNERLPMPEINASYDEIKNLK